jgi:hypothetical protein
MRFFGIIRAVLREVFEEAAYERFCAREKVAVTPESYAKFVRENGEARSKKVVRCC